MKVVYSGSLGQLGLELNNQLSWDPEIQSFGFDLHNLDITDEKKVYEVISTIKPDVVINSAAYTDVDGCESDEMMAYRVNAIGARNLSAAAHQWGAKIFQVSTDYVFDGIGTTSKRETDPIRPLSVYGKSKALGEQLVRETNPRHFIMRTAWLYGEGHNFVRTMLKLAKDNKTLNVVDDQFGSPTSTVDLASSILQLIRTDNYGTFHGTCEGSCSWFEFAQMIFSLKGMDVLVNPIKTEELNRLAPRPKYSVLENFMLNLTGMNTFRHWQEALREYLRNEP